MEKLALRLAISIVALLMLLLPLYVPQLLSVYTNPAVIVLIIIVFIPWLQPFVKGIDLSKGIVQFQDFAKSPEAKDIITNYLSTYQSTLNTLSSKDRAKYKNIIDTLAIPADTTANLAEFIKKYNELLSDSESKSFVGTPRAKRR